MKPLFWISLAFILYVYAGYPLVLLAWSRLRPRPVDKRRPAAEPLVTAIVAARNESAVIGKRLENLMSQTYPPDRLEIVVVSDGSTDDTAAIVERYAAADATTIRIGDRTLPRLRLVTIPENRGKPNALNAAVALAHGEIVVFADARQDFDPAAVRELVSNFSDPAVGSVSGELVFRELADGGVRTEIGLYWAIEKWIRKTEGSIHSIAGATGAIYAIRRSLFERIPDETILDDVYVPMKIVCGGRRNVFDERALAYDVFSKSMPQERRRKVRTLAGNYQLLRLCPELASPGANPIFFQFVSHKIARLFVPFFFIALFVAAFLAEGFLYRVAFAGIIALILLTVFSRYLDRVPGLGRLCAVSRTFFTLNYFAFLAFFKFFGRGHRDIW
jgi:cellulose synthase/poly-beta-1,6-N-acetylglucosamine synthase-like glycosyltransferase